MNPASTRHQRGGAIGTLIVLILLGVGAYYLYVEMFAGSGSRPLSCSEANQACIKECRRTSTEQAAIQSCQKECQQKLDACK